MLWDYLKTLIMLRLTLQSPCMCAGCKRGRRAYYRMRQAEVSPFGNDRVCIAPTIATAAGAPSRCACCGKWGTLPKNLGRSPTGVPVAAQSEP
jgi:hypothetical protein